MPEDIFKVLDNLSQGNTLLDPNTNLPMQKVTDPFKSIDSESSKTFDEIAPNKISDREVSSFTDEGIQLGTNTGNIEDMRANAQSNLTAPTVKDIPCITPSPQNLALFNLEKNPSCS